eukprot:10397926-Ditylum_brightwellii.AAC.1
MMVGKLLRDHSWAIVVDGFVEDWEGISSLIPSLEKAGVERVDGCFDVCSFRAQGEDPMNLPIYDTSQHP